MKKKLIAGAMAGAALLAMAAPLMADEPGEVQVCHIIKANDVIPFSFSGPPTVKLYFGKEISVPGSDVSDHIAHGDSTTFFGGEGAAGPIALFKAAGAKLPAANCYRVIPN